MPAIPGWTSEQEVNLVTELRRRKYLHAAWLPASAHDSVRFPATFDGDGKHRTSETLLRDISEAVFGPDKAKDAGAIRTKLSRMFGRYFKELSALDMAGTRDQHTLPIEALLDAPYRHLRAKLADTCPWWEKMHIMMIDFLKEWKHNAASASTSRESSPATGSGLPRNAKSEKMEEVLHQSSTSDPAALRGKQGYGTYKALAAALSMEKHQLQKELEIKDKDVTISQQAFQIYRLEEELRSYRGTGSAHK
ncbi:hypothetical protein OC861_002424 [Tilletia horrida]|nr:hypothetical protein OC845_002243 [Tilletia horrida]KAK0567973.1 hypothetical protein OC861_002424 [Tilletia horrida]